MSQHLLQVGYTCGNQVFTIEDLIAENDEELSACCVTAEKIRLKIEEFLLPLLEEEHRKTYPNKLSPITHAWVINEELSPPGERVDCLIAAAKKRLGKV